MIDAVEPFDAGRVSPGDFVAVFSGYGQEVSVRAGEPRTLDVGLTRVMRMTRPVDNTQEISLSPPFQTYQGPVRVEWEPVRDAESYAFKVVVCRTEFDCGMGSSMASGITAKTAAEVDLPSNKNGEHYLFILSAEGTESQLIVTGALGSGKGWARGYPFRIEAAATVPSETPVLPTPLIRRPVPSTPRVTILEIATVGDALKFNTDRLAATAGSVVVLTFKNASTVNQHTWVLVPAGTKDGVAVAGTAAGPDNDWIPQADDRVLARSSLLDPGQVRLVRFVAPPVGKYQFVCTFPGHSFTMFGDFEVTP